jgi:hypothetical protein
LHTGAATATASLVTLLPGFAVTPAVKERMRAAAIDRLGIYGKEIDHEIEMYFARSRRGIRRHHSFRRVMPRAAVRRREAPKTNAGDTINNSATAKPSPKDASTQGAGDCGRSRQEGRCHVSRRYYEEVMPRKNGILTGKNRQLVL